VANVYPDEGARILNFLQKFAQCGRIFNFGIIPFFMRQALVIFNGIRFSHSLVEKALAWAKQNSGGISALFLASHETEDQYAFPSDLDAAQKVTDKEDADQDDMRVIESQIKLMENMAKSEGVDFTSEIMVDRSLDEVLSKVRGASIIFIDAREEDEAGLMEVRKFKMKELVERLPGTVEKVE
jgi:hypothetical protein